MPDHGHRVQLFLFLAAVFVPCAALVALSFRIVDQDRELRVKRQADEQQEIAARAARDLVTVLDSIRNDEIRGDLAPGTRYRHPETAFVAWLEDDRLVLPWDPDRDVLARRAHDVLAQAPKLALANDPLQAANARWLLAQTLERAGQPQQAAPILRQLLDMPVAMTDEDGVPLKLHAAQSLLAGDTPPARIFEAVETVVSSRPWLPPLSSYVVADIAARLNWPTGDLRDQSAAQVRLLQQAEALQNDFASLHTSVAKWVPYGSEMWLIASADGAVFVVRAASLFQHLHIPGAVRLTEFRDPAGIPLGDSLPGLKLVLKPVQSAVPDSSGDLQRAVLYLALLLVVAATSFAAYLLWRDLKRDLRVAELRAQFVASVSHELKTPLTSIRMFAETLQLGRCDPAARDEYLGTIVNESERLSRLVDGVLLFSKLEQGKRVFRFRPTDPAEPVRDAVRALEYPLAQAGFHLHLNVQDDLPPIHADRDAIEQAVLNLLSNAMKFSGGAREIELSVARQDDAAVISVADHGIGITSEEQSRIFEKFYRVPNPGNRHIPGAGLGLALVAQIAHAHGGRVSVQSAPGKGSTFTLRVPLEPIHEPDSSH